MTVPTPLICAPWATVADLPATAPTLPPEEWARWLMLASEVLWALSGRQWSGASCEETARWVGEASWCLPPATSQVLTVLALPHDEVTSVTLVTVNGVAFTGYRRVRSWLHRTDGAGWGGTVDIVYQRGLAPPVGGVLAVVAYAVELAKAATGDTSCRLPKRVSSVTRQSVSMTILDPMTFLKEGKTGLADVDQWLAAVNPSGHPERGSMWSPDVAWAYPL